MGEMRKKKERGRNELSVKGGRGKRGGERSRRDSGRGGRMRRTDESRERRSVDQ